MYLKWLVSVICVLLLGGCKDLLNKPLEGEEKDLSRYALEGKWVAKEKNTYLELKETDKPGWFVFTLQEPGRVLEGKVMVAGFKWRLALNIDLASLTINGESLTREGQQAYFLVGAYFSDDELRIVPADMATFEHNFSGYFFASPLETASLCSKTSDTCKNTFTGGNLLYSKNRGKFNKDFVKHFRAIFPRRDSVIFLPAS